jgi:thiol-disulfide isomerase/thioredoxin
MRAFAIFFHGFVLLVSLLLWGGSWVLLLAFGEGSLLDGSLYYDFPSLPFLLPLEIGIVLTAAWLPASVLSALRLRQLLRPESSFALRWPGIRGAANVYCAIVLFVFAVYSFDSIPGYLINKYVLSGGAQKQVNLSPDSEVAFPALPFVPKPVNPYDLTLRGQDGAELELSQYKGKTVFMNIWATWCGPCRAEMPNLERLYERLKGDPNIVFVFVSDEEPDVVKAFVEESKHTLPVFTTTDEWPLPVRGYPTTVILSPAGDLVLQQTGSCAWDGGATEAFLLALSRGESYTPPAK